MAVFKRRIFRIAVCLVLLFLVLTLLSSTIARLNWPQVGTAAVFTDLEVDRSVSYATSVTALRTDLAASNGDGPDDVAPEKRCGAMLSLTFDELFITYSYNAFATVFTFMFDGENARQSSVGTNVTLAEVVHNSLSGKFDVYFILDPTIPVSVGFPVTISFSPKGSNRFATAVPLGSIFDEPDGSYIYAIGEKQSFWGNSNYVEKIAGTVYARSGQYAGITFADKSIPVPEQIAHNPSRTLQDGAPVLLAGAP